MDARPPGFTLFDTPIGVCGVVWSARGIAGVQLPEASAGKTRARLAQRFPAVPAGTPPPAVRRAVEAMTAGFRGEGADLATVVLDMEGVPEFHRRVYAAARAIPPGRTLTYGEIAARIGAPGAARAVGQALGRNPFPIVVPCHRVLAAGGKMGGFSADGGVATKRRMLALEHARAQPDLPARDGMLPFDWDAAAAHLRGVDAALARVIDAVDPTRRLELKRTRSLFGALAEAIVYQQLSGKAAATIYGRVCGLFPRASHGPTAEQIARIADAKLRAAGLSAAKVLSMKDLARCAKAGAIPTLAEARRLDDETIVERLTAVRGIGRWTAEMLLIFRLGRPDVLPVDDYGVRKGFAIAARKRALPSPHDLAARGRRWAPYRTVASWYLWRALELAK